MKQVPNKPENGHGGGAGQVTVSSIQLKRNDLLKGEKAVRRPDILLVNFLSAARKRRNKSKKKVTSCANIFAAREEFSAGSKKMKR